MPYHTDTIDPDFPDIVLLPNEKRFLKNLLRSGKLPLPDSMRRLHLINFVHANSTGQRDRFGVYINDGTYSISERYLRYRQYRRELFFRSSIWPSIVSGIVSFIVSMLLWRIKGQ